MNNSTKQRIFAYLIDAVLGRFAGFLLGISSTNILSLFFETRTPKNLWGILAKKPLLEKSTFSEVEWIISVLIGFIVSEVVNRLVRNYFGEYLPFYEKLKKPFHGKEEKNKGN